MLFGLYSHWNLIYSQRTEASLIMVCYRVYALTGNNNVYTADRPSLIVVRYSVYAVTETCVIFFYCEHRKPWSDCAYAQSDKGPRSLRLVNIPGPVVQSFVSLTSSLMTNSLTVVAKVFSNTLIFLLQKCE